jgi:quercetin dioxygenase-like cupin family protein
MLFLAAGGTLFHDRIAKMVEAVNLTEILADLPILHNRRQDSEADADNAFARLGELGEASLFVGSFSGTSPWERHQRGDELVQILAGASELTLWLAEGPKTLMLKANMLIIVPAGIWHRFHAPEQVTVLTATPQPTDISFEAEPE